MEEQLISFETAKLAKEKDFDLNSHGYYSCDNPSGGSKGNQLFLRDYESWTNFGSKDSQKGTHIYSAPSQSLLQRWLREVHETDIQIIVNYNQLNQVKSYRCGIIYITQLLDRKFLQTFFIRPKGDEILFIEFKTYEEALEEGLKEALKLIK